jgi:hypothetical protein
MYLVFIIIGSIIVTLPVLLMGDYGYSLISDRRSVLDILFGQRQDECELTTEDEELPTYKEYKEWQAQRPDLKTYKQYKDWLELNRGNRDGENGSNAEYGGQDNC